MEELKSKMIEEFEKKLLEKKRQEFLGNDCIYDQERDIVIIKNRTITIDNIGFFHYYHDISFCHNVESIIYENCTFTLILPKRELRGDIEFIYCSFLDCTFKDCDLYHIAFSDCSFKNIKSNNCSINLLSIYINGSYTNSIDYLLVTISMKYNNVDFTDISYERLYIRHNAIILSPASYAYVVNRDDEYGIKVKGSNIILPIETEVTGYKVVANLYKVYNNLYHTRKFVLMKILIDKDTPRVASVTSNKCRCSECKVLSFYEINIMPRYLSLGEEIREEITGISAMRAANKIDSDIKPLIYKKGEIVKSSYDDNMFETCTKGIHFFPTVEDALSFAWKYDLY